MSDKKALTAPCGLDCFNCELYEHNLTDQLANVIHEKYGVPLAAIPCKGCRAQDGKHYHMPNGCPTLDCAKAKGVDLCCDCDAFPCAMLAPLAEGASFYPHNFKLYNLCRIKLIGHEAWVEESAEIRRRYYKQPFAVGKGQAD